MVDELNPVTPTDQDDPLPPEEAPDEASVGAWMGERDPEPSEDPDPVEP